MKFYAFAFLLFAVGTAAAQHIGYLIPAGGRPGETVEVLIGGQQLGGVKSGYVSGSGVTVESVKILPSIPPISGRQQKFVMSWMRSRAAGKTEIPDRPQDEEDLKTWRKCVFFDTIDQLSPLEFHVLTIGVFVRRNPLQMSPAINSLAVARIRIDPDARPGRREFRLLRGNPPQAVSNYLPFYIDTLPGVREPYLPVPPQKAPRYEFQFPAVINGQIMPGETDAWHFTGKKGDRVVFQTFARSMIPFMGDCVPGFFQCVLELRDSRGQRIAYADDHGFDPDPLLCCTLPEDGEYTLRVRDALYRGRADFVYRIRAWLGEPPESKLSPPDWKLPQRDSRSLAANRKVDFPVLIRGCLDRPNAADRFVVTAKKGEKIVAEVFARRAGSSLDSRLTIQDSDGKRLAVNDDFPRLLAGHLMQHTDSYLFFTVPHDGNYTITVCDTAGHGDKNCGYFLRIDRPRPSFNLYVTPSASGIAVDGATRLKIQVEPQDGFLGDIQLRVDSPGSYSIIGSNTIPGGARSAEITLTATGKRRGLVKAKLIAEHEIKRKGCCPCCNPKIRGNVFYGDEDTQAFAYTHLILSDEWLLCKTWRPQGAPFVSLADPKMTGVKFPLGKTTQLVLRRKKLPPKAELRFALRNAPDGITLTGTEVKERENGCADIVLTLKAAEPVNGKLREPIALPWRFNMIIKGIYEYDSKPNKEGKVFRRTSEFDLPALLFEITKD